MSLAELTISLAFSFSQCKSPHIIEYYGVFFEDNKIHICTEFMDGTTLFSSAEEPASSPFTSSLSSLADFLLPHPFLPFILAGGSLDRYIVDRVIPPEVLAVIITKVLKGLHYLSEMKIMHRDVKPSNILINSKGMVKLCDFGKRCLVFFW